MKSKKYPAKFFHELVKTTYADQYLVMINRHGWTRKLELIKRYSSPLPAEVMMDELDRSPSALQGDLLDELTAWSFAIVNYYCSGIFNNDKEEMMAEAAALHYVEQVVFWFADNMANEESRKAFSSWPVVLWQMAKQQFGWAKQNRPSYVLSPDLAEMLQYTKLDQLPVENLRLPFTSLILAPSEKVMRELFDGQGCLMVFEGTHYFEEPGKAAVGEHYVWHIHHIDSPRHSTPLGVFRMDIPNRTVAEVVEEAAQQEYKDWEFLQKKIAENPESRTALSGFNFREPVAFEQKRKAMLFVCACMVYATMSDADIILASDSPEYKAWIASLTQYRFTRKERAENEMHKRTGSGLRFYLGRQIKIIDRHTIKDEDGYEERVGHASPRLHWRSGHYRRSWHGSGENKHAEIHWIKPTLVGVPQGGNVLERRAGMR